VSLPANVVWSHRVRTLLNILLVSVDLLALLVAFMVAYKARNLLDIFPIPGNPPVFAQYIPTMLLHVITTMFIFYASRLYHLPRTVSRIDQVRKILGAVTLGAVVAFGLQALFLTAIFQSTFYQVDYPRSLFVYVWFFSMLFTEIGREIYRLTRYYLRRWAIDSENLLIIGTGKVARELTTRIRGRHDLGYNLVGVVTSGQNNRSNVAGVPVIGEYNDIPALIDRFGVEQVIIALPEAQRNELVSLITMCQRGHVDIKVYPDLFAYMAGDLNVDELGGTPLITVRDIALRGWKLSLKRGLDIFGSMLGMIFLSPLMLLTALLVRLESPGPIFYIQERMGLDGRSFPMIKFRSMRQDAEVSGPGWTVENDPRRTHLGALMRRTNWDEIPQLINVLLGHMSLVGPRPERPFYVHEFRNQIPRYMERHREKSGMTGWAQVNGLRGDTSIAERTAYDLWYIENWSLWLDIKIILRTILMVILRSSKNAY
jgi:exopolysaccharide biosynthesis polyprenyl glycosylphosphotransferase